MPPSWFSGINTPPTSAEHPARSPLFVPQHHRQLDGDAGSLARRASDAAFSTQQPSPLPNPLKAEMPLRNSLGVKSHAPVTDLDSKTIPSLQETDRNSLALAVFAGICQGFLGNSVDGIFQGRVQPVEINPAAILDLRSFEADVFVYKMADGSHNAFLIENRRPDPGDQATGLEMPLAEHGHPGVVGVGGLRRLGLLQNGRRHRTA